MNSKFNQFLKDNNLTIKRIIEHTVSNTLEIIFTDLSLTQMNNIESIIRNFFPFISQVLIKQEEIKKDDFSDNEKSSFSLEKWKENQLREANKVSQEINKNNAKKQSNNSKQNKVVGPIELKAGDILYGKSITKEAIPIDEIDFSNTLSERDVCLEGEIFLIDTKDNEKSRLFNIYITDYTSSIIALVFVPLKNEELLSKFDTNIKKGNRIKVFGNIEYNDFSKDKLLRVHSIELLPDKKRVDSYPDKRVELHLHSQYSTLDGISKVGEILQKAKEFGHTTLGITDHAVLQAYPDFQRLSKNYGIRMLYGVEGYLVDTGANILTGESDNTLDDEFIFFDLETTGTSIYTDKVIEIAAVLVKNGEIKNTYQTFVNPHQAIPPKITELTGITNQMVYSGKEEDEAFEGLLDFIGDKLIAAHNASFDTAFLNRWLLKKDINKSYSYIDSLPLARSVVPEIGRYNMGRLCSFFKIKNDHAHRAIDDSIASAKVLLKLFERAKERGVTKVSDLNSLLDIETMAKKIPHTNHATIYAKNQKGLYDLYKLISDSHLKYFQNHARIPKELLNQNRENLLIGSGCSHGELFEALLDKAPDPVLEEIAAFYDFLEVQPIENNLYLGLNNSRINKELLKSFNKKIVEIGKRLGIPVVATSDSHFLEPHDSITREIIKSATSKGKSHHRAPLYYRTTQEMLDEFSYLGEDLAKEIVIENTNKIAEIIEDVKPIPDGTYPPIIEGADEDIKEMCLNEAHRMYGENLPEFVQKRMDRELNSIIDNGYAVLYLIAQKLVQHSEEDGFIVGSRGSVGSSFVARLCGITEVNSLPAHYICPNCHYTELANIPGSVGPDLEDKNCPHCGTKLIKDGFDIPFETFLGFEGDKEPDIDLNFSGDNQGEAHRYTEVLFGKGKTFRAGTISTIQEATAFGYVKNYFDNIEKVVSKAEIERLKHTCTGVKRTTGQHPGGIMVVPKNKDIFEFTPVQHPADDNTSPTITTHFDYHSISGRLLKLDILGHDDPTMLRRLQLLTGVDPKTIPLDDKAVIELFTGVESLNFKRKCSLELGNSGIPEFGTSFVRQMIKELKPKTFADLIRVSGWSHGTDVWTGNAQQLLKDNIDKDKVISTRDDIMLSLIQKGLKPIDSFTIMEHVRKGNDLTEEEEKIMRENHVEEWFIDSCNKIKYLFPKAHAVAYVTMAYRIAWYKVNYPLAYYACYFGIRAKEFDLKVISSGFDAVNEEINRIKELSHFQVLSNKDAQSLVSLELALEMYARGYKCLPVDLKKSHYNKFLIEEDAIRPPFNTISGMGDLAAESLYNTLKNENILSQEELLEKSKITKTNLSTLEELGCLEDIPKSNQVTFF